MQFKFSEFVMSEILILMKVLSQRGYMYYIWRKHLGHKNIRKHKFSWLKKQCKAQMVMNICWWIIWILHKVVKVFQLKIGQTFAMKHVNIPNTVLTISLYMCITNHWIYQLVNIPITEYVCCCFSFLLLYAEFSFPVATRKTLLQWLWMTIKKYI